MRPDELEDLRDRLDLSTSPTKAEDFEAAAGMLTEGEYGRAALLAMAADHWQMRGDLDRARRAVDAAGEGHPGEMWIHPLAVRLSIEIAAGDVAAQEAALAGLLERWRAAELTITTCSFIGGTLEIDGQLKRAHRWFTLPLTNVDPDDELEFDEEFCVFGRARVRSALGLPVDRFDRVAAELLASR